MRKTWMVPAIVLFITCQQSAAETWKADLVLDKDKSAASCAPDGGGTSEPYVLDFADGIFTASTSVAKYVNIKVQADGAIRQGYRTPSGNRLEMVGNVKSKELTVVNSTSGCRWKLIPR